MITTRREPSLNLTILTGSGSIEADEIIEAMNAMYADDPTKLVLWDLSEADISSISYEGVQRIAELAVEVGGMRTGAKTAIITAQQIAFGISRVYESLVDATVAPINILVCWTQKEALDFLGITALP